MASARLDGRLGDDPVLEEDEAASILKDEFANSVFLEEVTSHISCNPCCGAYQIEE